MNRRSFLQLGAASSALAACSKLNWLETTPAVNYPGMREGHRLRDKQSLPLASGEITTDVVILGSGVAGLTAAWRLSQAGQRNFLVVSGPEFGGNAAGGHFGDLTYPRGAHYLPLPSMESTHIREMLFDLGVILDNPNAEHPYFDEAAVVHAPDERLFIDEQWQEGLIPTQGVTTEDALQQARFFQYIEVLKGIHGSDGKKTFAVPLALSSMDEQWTKLDRITFRQWLLENGYTAEPLHWYLNYCCRDDYGMEYDKVSAWAGLYYFASRGGLARNAMEGAVLTWPDGLHTLVRRLTANIDKRVGAERSWQQAGIAVEVSETKSGVTVLCAHDGGSGLRTFHINAKRAIVAMPLLIASRIVSGMNDYGFDHAIHMPSYAPWLVSNFLMKGFPRESKGAALSWDNVVYRGKGLGYVVSTHQNIRAAVPEKTVFSAYQTLSSQSPSEARRWLTQAMPDALREEAACDLDAIYGWRLWRHVEALDITVRGHAMASPLCGFRSNKGIDALRNIDGKILFAHSDLSGLSVFEEAAWWGDKAARRIL